MGLEQRLSQRLGIKVEITIRAKNRFTLSFDGENKKAVKDFKTFMGPKLKRCDHEFDLECDMTCIWFDI